MLSTGSVAYSIDDQNTDNKQGICTSGPYSAQGRSSGFSTAGSNISWDYTTVQSSIVPGTSEGILCAATPVNTDPDHSPEATWYPYILQDGVYDILYFTPDCAFDATCGQRGFVDVVLTITGNDGTRSQTTTINQEVTSDTSTVIYSGIIQPIQQDEQVMVTMTLSNSQTARLPAGMGNKYYLVADKIIVVADDTAGNGSTVSKIGTGMNSVNNSITTMQQILAYEQGYGIWEWAPENSTSSPTLNSAINGTQQVQSLSSASPFNRLAFAFDTSANITQLLSLPDGSFTFIAGDFLYTSSALSARSVLAFSNGLLKSPNGGLDGPVSSLAVLDGYLYAVGDFNSTADGTVMNLYGAARTPYASLSASWQPIFGLSSDTPPQTVSALDGDTLAFTYEHRFIDIWSPSNASLIVGTSSFVIGSFDAAETSSNGSQVYLGGQLYSLNSLQSSGVATLTSKGLQPAAFAYNYSATADEPASSGSEGNTANSMTSPSSLLAALKNRLRRRQSSPPVTNSASAIPSTILSNSTEPKILAGAFWTNSLTKQDVTILAGSFVSSDGRVENIGILSDTGMLSPLSGTSPSGTIKSLTVAGDILWVGGDFKDTTGQIGQDLLATYDLKEGQWNSRSVFDTGITAVGSGAQINTLNSRDGNVVVSGLFSTLGNVSCASICEWEKKTRDWKPYGDGLNGTVSSLAFAGVRNLLHIYCCHAR